MSKPEFTPGPWSFRQNRNCSLDFFGEGGHRLILGNTFLINQVANAHLIATAPELYEALETAIEEINHLRKFAGDNGAMIDDTDFVEGISALAKARGETHPSGGDRHGE
ncbi:hypothetical protein F9K88_07710 [Brucella intermedia]|uniref:hypothetical protein n=1 Tax=Brucella intermedia TaxID=94625 RepID=UPI00124ED0A2|nr:hypothetical protein [Brucella intermedia]KAB2712834.1 hypothetical protein F9K88_07710 [Brucella intermedia]